MISPARDAKERRMKLEAVELCGKNRGPHNYIPIEWVQSDTCRRVTRMLCTVCFMHISMKVLMEEYPEIKLL